MTIGNNNFSFMNNYREVMSLMRSAFGTSKFNDEDMVVFFGAILLLRKHDSLLLNYVGNEEEGEDIKEVFIEAGYRLSYSVERIKEIASNKEDFIRFIDDVLSIARVAENKRNLLTAITAFNCDDLQEDDYLDVFDTAIAELSYSNRVVFQQPRELSELVAGLVGEGMKTVFDPFGGLMDFATTMKDKMFVAYETHSYTYDLARLRLALAGVYDHCFLLRKNAEEWIPENDFNYIITNPPYGPKLRMYDSRTEESAELVALNRFESTTKEDGQLIAILPQSVLSNEQNKVQRLREIITQKNLLDTIICLPNNILPFSRISMAIVVLNKQRNEDDPIKLVDASSCYVGKERQLAKIDVDAVKALLPQKEFEFTKDEILEQHASWNVQWYLERRNTVFSEGYFVVELSEVMASVEPCRHFDETKGRVVNVTSLSSDVYRYEKSVDGFPESSDLKGTTKVAEPVLLLSLIGVPKPTYCSASAETPIFLKSDVCAYRVVNKTVHLGYLCMELAKRLKATKGAVIPRLSKAQILQTRVEFPSLNDQRSLFEQGNIFEETSLTAGLGKEMERKFILLLEKKKQEYIQEVRNRKHDMKTPMGQMRSTLKLLDSLASQITGEPAEKLTLYVQRQKRAMDTLSEIVSHIADEEVFATPEPINLGDVLSSCQTATEKYVIAYYPDEAVLKEAGLIKPMVMMGKSDLLRLFQNIIGNAIERGFVDDHPEYSLNISLTIKEGFYVIDFGNNGRPLPEGMTKERYGMKGVKGKGSDGEGKGGYIVKSITEHYGGDYDIYSQQFAGMWFTHVIVKLPIYQDNE